jgi:hypothetical protein
VECLVNPDQLKVACRNLRETERLRVTVPDFLNQSRLLAAGRYAEVVQRMGLAGVATATMAALPVLAGERAVTFWVAGMGLLGAGLRSIPSRFRGTLLLQGYLTDLALSMRRIEMLDRMLATCRRICPEARIGFHTNMAAEALNALWMLETEVDEVSVLTSPNAVGVSAVLKEMRGAGKHKQLRLTAEVGLAPAVVHRLACRFPERWASGAETVLIGLDADPALAKQRSGESAVNWAKAFPGTAPPEGML